ncbi:Metal-dependent_phosphoesterase [Hexamita inflata]|uniref:Metal-dependent phosphoesterase n=1 Tax=Hexamita inflata TaxID=28002 RepID=A0AA86NVL6_9EUKA|nr:Metal-dependent phosphoesterase [Hexamita inflata]
MHIDLHMHTTCSDGDTSPESVLAQCKSAGLDIVAITDHDTLEAHQILTDAQIPSNILLIPGVELSVSSDVDGLKHHLLAYFPQFSRGSSLKYNTNVPFSQEFIQFSESLNKMREARIQRAFNYFKKLNEVYSLNLDFEEFCVLNKINLVNKTSENVIGRPLIAKYLVLKGLIEKSGDAFKKYLSDNSPAYQALPKTSMEDNIKQVKKIGGKCFIAHPGIWGYTEEQVQKHIQSAQAAGLDGIEKYHSEQTSPCEGVVSRGSDFHGPSVKADTFLNVTKGNLTETEEKTLLDTLFGKQ